MAKLLAVNWRDLKNPDAGGAEVHLQEILSRLAAKGHDVTLFASNFPGGAERESYDGITVIRKGNWYNANFVLPGHVKSFLRDNPCDLVIEDINKIPFFLPAVVKPKVLPVIPHLFGATVFRETNPLFASYVYFWELLIPFVYRNCRFVVISSSTRDDLAKRGINKDRIDVSVCGLDHSTYRVLDGVERFSEPTIVHFGRVRKYKSIDVVIKAFALIRRELKDARLLIIGDGPERGNLERMTAGMGLDDSVVFRGAVPTDELVKTLNQAHLFLNASPKEGWGLTVVEANACGMPVIASNRPGLRDSVVDKETGYLVEYGNVRAFAEKALEVLADRDLWARLSRAARTWAERHTWENTAAEMEAIILRELDRPDR